MKNQNPKNDRTSKNCRRNAMHFVIIPTEKSNQKPQKNSRNKNHPSQNILPKKIKISSNQNPSSSFNYTNLTFNLSSKINPQLPSKISSNIESKISSNPISMTQKESATPSKITFNDLKQLRVETRDLKNTVESHSMFSKVTEMRSTNQSPQKTASGKAGNVILSSHRRRKSEASGAVGNLEKIRLKVGKSKSHYKRFEKGASLNLNQEYDNENLNLNPIEAQKIVKKIKTQTSKASYQNRNFEDIKVIKRNGGSARINQSIKDRKENFEKRRVSMGSHWNERKKSQMKRKKSRRTYSLRDRDANQKRFSPRGRKY